MTYKCEAHVREVNSDADYCPEKYLSSKEAEEYSGLSVGCLQAAVKRGKLEAKVESIGKNKYWFTKESLDIYKNEYARITFNGKSNENSFYFTTGQLASYLGVRIDSIFMALEKLKISCVRTNEGQRRISVLEAFRIKYFLRDGFSSNGLIDSKRLRQIWKVDKLDEIRGWDSSIRKNIRSIDSPTLGKLYFVADVLKIKFESILDKKVHYCEVCHEKIQDGYVRKHFGHYLCRKHHEQVLGNGRIIINGSYREIKKNPHTFFDDYVIFDLLDSNGRKIDEFYVDKEDFGLVNQHYWRKTHWGYVSTKNDLRVHRLVMNIGEYDRSNAVDHIDGNKLNNRKDNLRICSHSQNMKNRRVQRENTSGFTGVHFDNRKQAYRADINKASGNGCWHLIESKDKRKAVYCRYVAEELVMGEFVNQEEHLRKQQFTQNLPEETKREIEEKVRTKLLSKGLIIESAPGGSISSR